MGPRNDVSSVQARINVGGIEIVWDIEKGTTTFGRLPVAMMWVDSTLAGLMSGVQAMVGPERFWLALQSEGRKSVDADWQVISKCSGFRQGFEAISKVAAVAGWGEWTLASVDTEAKTCVFRVKEGWEARYQTALGVCWGSGMLAGKFAGYCSNLLGTNCWAEQTMFAAEGDEYDEFVVSPSDRTVEDEIDRLCLSDSASRADMAVALKRLEAEILERKQSERALQESEAKYRFLAEQVHDIIWIVDLDLNTRYVSPSIEKVLGFTPEERMAQSLSEQLTPGSLEFARTTLMKELQDDKASGTDPNKILTIELGYYRKDGSVACLENVVSFIRDENFRPTAIYGLSRDITERKRAEELLRTNEERLRLAWETCPDAFSISRLDDGVYVDVNTGYLELTGYSREELIGKSAVDLSFWHTPDDREKLVRDLKQYGHVRNQETKMRRKDGQVRTILISAGFMTLDGKPHILGLAKDIEDIKQTAEAVRESEERYRQLVHHARDLIYRTATNGIITFVNPVASLLIGYSEQELVGHSYLEFVRPEASKEVARFYGTQFEERLSDTYYELPLLTKEGKTVWVGQQVQLIFEDDELVGFQAIARDITDRKQAEQALRDSEERYRTLVEESFDGIFIQKGTEIVFANSCLYDMLGYIEPELIGKEHWEIYHPDYWELTRSRAQARIRGESVPSKYEVKLQRKNGLSFDGEINARPLIVEGQPGVQVWIRDITERKRAEESLRESEQRYRDLFDNSADLIYTHDMEGNYTSANKAVEGLLGYTPEEFLKLNFRQIVDPDYLEITEENFRRKANGRVERTGPYEVLVHTKTGQRLWLEVNSRIMLREGRRIGVHGTARDVTERKIAQEQLKKLFAAVEQAGETIVVADPTGTIEYVNPSFEATTGYTPDECIGRNPRFLKSGRHDQSFYREMWTTITSGAVWRGRFVNKKKDGTLFEETATISPIKDETGRVVNYVCVKRDITNEVMLQKQLMQAQKMEALGTLAGGIAHDFNNLLQAILGYADLLLMHKGASDPDRAKLKAIVHTARDGADLVSRILTFSKKGESKIRPISLNDEIRRVAKLLRRTLPRMIQIDLVLAEDLRIIDADPAQIEQVLLNLSVNAHHAMPDGGQLLIETRNVSFDDEYVSRHLGTKPGQYVLLTVSDTGAGMRPEVLDRVFEPFYTTKANGEGTGLGLSIVHGIIAQHRGYIRCYSELNRGTSFKIYFPISGAELIPDLSSTRAMPAFGTETILLVDDDDRIREMGRQLIEIGGYQVITAQNAETALELYETHKKQISLVVLDLIMPGMSGSRCLERLVRIDPDVKVLLVSGYSENGLTVGEKGAGARGFVRKPYDAKDILGAIRKVLDEGYLY